MFNGEDISPLYYVAVILDVVSHLSSDAEIDEFFDTLKRVFKSYIQHDPPPSIFETGLLCHLIQFNLPFNPVYFADETAFILQATNHTNLTNIYVIPPFV